MTVRMATVAGQFYESTPQDCIRHIESLLPSPEELPPGLPDRITAGIVPHAGWVFSGRLALMVLQAIKVRQSVDTFVIFGAVHRAASLNGMLYDKGQWGTPLGIINVDEPLGQFILAEGAGLIHPDTASHSREHSIEVQVPFIQYLFPEAEIMPIMVPPVTTAHQIGQAVGRAVRQYGKKVVCLASTDLTHYGPSYGFTAMGTGIAGLRWARDENDRHFINQALNMEDDKIVESAQMYHNACGPGAVAAAIAAARVLGAAKGYLLAHTTSAEVMEEKYGQSSDDSVGYAAIVYGYTNRG